MSDKIEGMCSVCLRKIQLRDDRPIRHGFHAFGVRHGQNSGYHSGPCRGIEYPYLGVTDKGTRWALDDVKKTLDRVLAEIDRLKRKPPLTFTPDKRLGIGKRVPDLERRVTVNPGDERKEFIGERGSWETIPSYAELNKRHLVVQEHWRDELANMQDRYEEVLRDYSPAKYQGAGVASKEVIHLAHEYNSQRFGKYTAQACRLVRPGGRGSKAKLTTDPSKVTCLACKKQLGTRH